MSEQRRKLVLDYLLGEMSGPEITRFEAELDSDPELRQMTDEMRPVVNRLESLPSDAWEPPEPPPLRMPGAATEAPTPEPAERAPRVRTTPRFRWPRLAAGLAAACVLLGTGIFIGTRLEDPDGGISGPTQTLALASLGEAPPGATGKVSLASSSEDAVTLDVSGLKPTGGGEFYELWLLGEDNELVALGSFRVKPDGDSEIEVPLPVNPSDYKYFDVSIQEDNGDPNHSGRSVLRGLSQA